MANGIEPQLVIWLDVLGELVAFVLSSLFEIVDIDVSSVSFFTCTTRRRNNKSQYQRFWFLQRERGIESLGWLGFLCMRRRCLPWILVEKSFSFLYSVFVEFSMNETFSLFSLDIV